MSRQFPAAPERELPDEEPGVVSSTPLPISCACASCDEERASDAALLAHRPEQVTIVRTYKDPRISAPTSTKAFVACRDGRTGVGNGHSDAQAIFDALRGLGPT